MAKAKYTVEQKVRIVEAYLSGEGSYESLAEKYGVGSVSIKDWVRKYREHGKTGLLPRHGNSSYSSAFKGNGVSLCVIKLKLHVILLESYGRKERAAAHIDELIQVARFNGYREDKSGKHENDIGEDGFNYYMSYFRDFDGKYYQMMLSSALNAGEKTAYSIGEIRERRFPAGTGSSSQREGLFLPKGGGSSSQREALKNGRKPSAPIIYTSEEKSQEVKSAVQIAFEKAMLKKDGGKLSQWDGGTSDRELLLEAATEENASEALKNYAARYRDYERLLRRERRLEERLNEARERESGRKSGEKSGKNPPAPAGHPPLTRGATGEERNPTTTGETAGNGIPQSASLTAPPPLCRLRRHLSPPGRVFPLTRGRGGDKGVGHAALKYKLYKQHIAHCTADNTQKGIALPDMGQYHHSAGNKLRQEAR